MYLARMGWNGRGGVHRIARGLAIASLTLSAASTAAAQAPCPPGGVPGVQAANGQPDIVIAPDGQLQFRGLPTEPFTAGGPTTRRVGVSERRFQDTVTVEIARNLVSSGSWTLRVDTIEPNRANRLVACGRVPVPRGGRAVRVEFRFPDDVGGRSQLLVRVYRELATPRNDDVDVTRAMRRAHASALAARITALDNSMDTAADTPTWQRAERRAVLWQLTNPVAGSGRAALRAAFDAVPPGADGAATEVRDLVQAVGETRSDADFTADQWQCAGAPTREVAQMISRSVVCSVAQALLALPATAPTTTTEVSQYVSAVQRVMTGRWQPTSPPAPSAEYCRSYRRRNWLARDDVDRLFARGRLPFVTDQDQIRTLRYGRDNHEELLPSSASVGVIVQNVSGPLHVDTQITAAPTAADPVAQTLLRAATLLVRYARPAPPNPALFVMPIRATSPRAARPWCAMNDPSSKRDPALIEVDDGLAPVHARETYAVPVGTVGEGRQATVQLCAGARCITSGSTANVRQRVVLRVEAPHAFVMLASVGGIIHSPVPTVFDPVVGATGPDQVFRVRAGEWQLAPSVGAMLGARFCRQGFVGLGTSLYLDGFDALQHWYVGIGGRVPEVSSATYLMLTLGLVVDEVPTGYEVDQVVSVPRAMSGATSPPTSPTQLEAMITIGVQLAFDVSAVADLTKELIEAAQ